VAYLVCCGSTLTPGILTLIFMVADQGVADPYTRICAYPWDSVREARGWIGWRLGRGLSNRPSRHPIHNFIGSDLISIPLLLPTFPPGTGKSACHLRSSANTGCVQVANLKRVSAVICVQSDSLACTLMFVMLASACICEHLRTRRDDLFLTCVYPSTCSMCEGLKLSSSFNT
jgi:hypothetical protein